MRIGHIRLNEPFPETGSGFILLVPVFSFFTVVNFFCGDNCNIVKKNVFICGKMLTACKVYYMVDTNC